MPQLEHIPRKYVEVQSKDEATLVQLESGDDEHKFSFTFEAVKANIFRVNFSADTHPLPPYPSIPRAKTEKQSIKPSEETSSSTSRSFELSDIKASVEWKDTPVISLGWKNDAQPIHTDLPERSYVADGPGIAHYTRHDRHAFHVGLGEKPAPMDLTGRPFIISATDCFGYDSYKTDPTYKHMPLLVKATPQGCVAMVSSSYSRGFWSVGSEIDGLWGHFKIYRQDYGGLEEYLILGRTLKDVVKSYAELVGFPLLVPKWAFGYLSGGYKYTMSDDPPAHQELLDFAAKLKEHDIPCSAHQMSSGYSIAAEEPKVRNVFNWNKHRFPDPEKWLSEYHALGIRLLSNIKPYVLESHPDYKYLAEVGGLFKDRNQNTGDMKLWSAGGGEGGNGSHIDFSSAAAFEWWKNGVSMLKKQGIDAMWNDNNEYTLPSDDWSMKLDGLPHPSPSQVSNTVGLWGRAMHTELMGKASYEGLLKIAPNERPFVLTRSACIGSQRYCCSSWSGDNMTSWDAMKGANAQSLNAGVSLLHCYGHDIGGFEGPQPSPELLLRWVQLGIYSPRFAINCFKTSPTNNAVGEVIEPWMYPEITPLIRDTIKRRYEILPYIYSLALESHLTASPPQRWIGWGYESDPEVWSKFLKGGEEQYWFGDSMMIGGVYEPGVSAATMYLPRKKGDEFDYGYVNMNAPYEYLASGQWVRIASEWKESIPVLAKIGCAIPVGRNVQTRMAGEHQPNCLTLPEDDYRGVEIFPPKGSSHGNVFSSTWFEDDGISLETNVSSFTVTYSSTEEKITVGFASERRNRFQPPWTDLDFILLPGDQRFLVSDKGIPLDRIGKDSAGRTRFRMRQALVNSKIVTLTNGVH